MNSIINFTLKDHGANQFVPFTAKTLMFASYPHVYSQMFSARNASVAAMGEVSTSSTLTRPSNPFFANRMAYPTRYVGADALSVPYNINEVFSNFTYIAETSLVASTDIDVALTNLYPDNDVDPKLYAAFNGLQMLRIPKNRFDTQLTNQTDIDANAGQTFKPNLGKYYIRVSPKYIETTIAYLFPRIDETDLIQQQIDNGVSYTQAEYAVLNGTQRNQRTMYAIDKEGFRNTAWDFESTYAQRGRLYGSIVEVWNSTMTTLKVTKLMAENIINPLAAGPGDKDLCCLEYDAFGFDAPTQIPGVGDILRIYPRETYFEPFVIEVDYIGVNNDLTSLISFMKNDVARNLDNGVYEVYDEKGITLDANKNLSGTVIQSYQISREGKYEIRRGVGISNPKNKVTPTGSSTGPIVSETSEAETSGPLSFGG